MESRFFHNPGALAALDGPIAGREPLALHRRLPGYTPSPLLDAPGLAARLGVGRLWVKDESCRLGLPAFKILGASWAVERALNAHTGGLAPWESLPELRAQVAPLGLTLAAATDGNHGRAVARMAAALGCAAHIFVPAGTAQARIDALNDEGADVTVVDGTYDDAVARSAELAGPRCLVVSDTSWPGYEDIPRQVIAGYGTIFHEIDDALAARGEAEPDAVVVQMGVGALAAAVVRHYRRPGGPKIVGVEPTRAACVLASLEAGRIVEVPGPHDSIMAGLNCGAPSLIAWPLLQAGLDAAVAVDDELAREGMRLLAKEGVVAGETGAAGVAGLLALAHESDGTALSRALGLGPRSRVLVLVTEGATDPEAYEEIVGRPAAGCAERGRCPLCAGGSVRGWL
jgi:diaminopropionate ammonia-lyase